MCVIVCQLSPIVIHIPPSLPSLAPSLHSIIYIYMYIYKYTNSNCRPRISALLVLTFFLCCGCGVSVISSVIRRYACIAFGKHTTTTEYYNHGHFNQHHHHHRKEQQQTYTHRAESVSSFLSLSHSLSFH